MALSMPPSLARDPSCLASLTSNYKLLAPLSQHLSSQVTMCSPGWRLKCFHMPRSSLRDRDPVMISFSVSRDDPGSLSSLPERSALFASLVLQGRLLPAQVGYWAQPRCLLLELGLEPLPCPLGKPRQTLQLWLQQRWCRSEGLRLPAGLEGLQLRLWVKSQPQCLQLRFHPFPL